MATKENGKPKSGNTKVTRKDWLDLARDVLVSEGAGQVKILTLASRMGVSRSSFYWYFDSRDDLLDALLAEWEARNTAQIEAHCRLPARNITEAVCNFFRCFVDPARFDQGLDFAIREWSRRDGTLRTRIDLADGARIAAVTRMFIAQGYAPEDADARGRILYFMQLGYHALEVRESMAVRMSRITPYVRGFTGAEPDPEAIDAFVDFTLTLGLD